MGKYITGDEYKLAKGIDLNIELQDDDNKSNKVGRFITEVTDWCVEYLIQNYGAVELSQFEKLIPQRQEYFKKGVMEQIDYILRNGFISLDSGYNAETGVVVNLSSLYLAPNAKQKFRMGGFANIMRGRYNTWGKF